MLKVFQGRLDIEKYKNEKGIELIAKKLKIAYPSK